ncbi:glycolate oxidase subunit GLCD [Nitzschia inconspicua]|uniref:Glycolate oxidase subunit GLCD n=1 Tax=Nitzschia inconspicua TaxID=303405 RepID=A0A9K3PJX3_9STRA|nr:glycolate oxidase subunit GLCD [Nitzschia inconspicua]
MCRVLTTQTVCSIIVTRPSLFGRSSFKRPISSTVVSNSSELGSPTANDARQLLLRMNSRPGSVLTTLMQDNGTTTATTISSQSLDKYNIDWTKKYRGQSSLVVRPNSTQEVAAILRYCYEHRLPVVPQGGNTGLVGGSVPLDREIVVSLEKMNTIHNLQDNILQADAGCILQDLQDNACQHRCLVPVDLGAKGTCQIGGNISTNAGGVYYFRYGSLHANCLGLEVVDGTGQILNLSYSPRPHLKDNTGYDLKHLFIGAEGTLGIITKVALWCPPLPTSVGAVWVTCSSLQDVLGILALAKTQYLTEILAAFEFMDHKVLRLVRATHATSVKLPVDIDCEGNHRGNDHAKYSILIETHGSNEEHDQDKLSAFLEHIMERNLVVDGVVAQNVGQVEEFWKVRDICNPSAAATGFVYKYDVSLPVDDFDNFIAEIKSKLNSLPLNTQYTADDLQCVNWGHIIDGNLHCNIVSVGKFDRDPLLTEYVEKCILQAVTKRNGSISAEHGLGQYKNKYMNQIKDRTTLQTMRRMKKLFDPAGIMNPGKYLPNEKEN